MKHLFLFFAFLLTVNLLFSQGRFGYTEQEIRADFSTIEFKVDSDYYGHRFIYGFFDDAMIIYYFNSDGLSFLTTVFPYTQSDLNNYVSVYNSQYMMLSETHWKAYLETGSIIDITLIIPKKANDIPYFQLINKRLED